MAGSSLVSTLILLVAIVYPFISLIREVPISPSFNMDTTSTEYNIKDIKAPKVSGPLIHALAYVVAKSPLSPFILVSSLHILILVLLLQVIEVLTFLLFSFC